MPLVVPLMPGCIYVPPGTTFPCTMPNGAIVGVPLILLLTTVLRSVMDMLPILSTVPLIFNLLFIVSYTAVFIDIVDRPVPAYAAGRIYVIKLRFH